MGEATLFLEPQGGLCAIPTACQPSAPVGESYTLRGKAYSPPCAQGMLSGCWWQQQACSSCPGCYRDLWALPEGSLPAGQVVSSLSLGVCVES